MRIDMKSSRTLLETLVAAASLILLIVVSRVLPHLPNFAPAAAVALFAGYFFRNRLVAVLVPVTGMLVTDLFFAGTYGWKMMAFVYLPLLLPVLFRSILEKENRLPWLALKIGGLSLLSSVVFFTVSNFGVWLVTGMYSLTPSGLWTCFLHALPFAQYTLLGDLCFNAVIFGSFFAAVYAKTRIQFARVSA